MRVLTVLLALTTLGVGLWSAHLWLQASEVKLEPGWMAESGEEDVQRDGWIWALIATAEKSSALNARAAWWTAVTAFAGAVTTIVGVLPNVRF